MAQRSVTTLAVVSTGVRADWITLDGGGMLVLLVGWALAAGFALGAVVYVAAASFPQPKAERTTRAQKAALCAALALLLGMGLPVIFDAMSGAARDVVATWTLLWAPALVALGALLVRQIGRPL